MQRRSVIAGLGVTAALAVAAGAAGSRAHDSAARTATTIAAVSTGDFRVVVTAEKRADSSGAPIAVVTSRISKHARGTWRQVGSHRLRSTYFWYTVTGPLPVCRLDIRTTAAKAGFRPHVTIRLLQSPSIGCGPTHRFILS